MNDEEILKIIRETVSENSSESEPDKINLTDDLFDLRLRDQRKGDKIPDREHRISNITNLLHVVIDLEDKCSIEIGDEELLVLWTVADIFNLVKAKVNKQRR